MDYIVGLFIGTVLGLTGAGGSVFAVPLLVYFLKLSPQDAIGVSLGAVCASALFGTLTQLKTKNIQWLPALTFATLGALTSPIGVYLNALVNGDVLLYAFSILITVVAIRMWRQAQSTPQATKYVRSSLSDEELATQALCRVNENNAFKIGLPCVLGMSGAAIATGILSGLFGVGGGFLIVPTLLFLTSISIQQAIATSLVVITLVSLTGFATYLVSGNPINFDVLGHVALGGMAGMVLGLVISRYIAGPQLQKGFAVLMLITAAVIFYSRL